MALYSAYGLTIESDVGFPELAPGAGPAGVRFRLDCVTARATDVTPFGLHYAVEPESAYLRYDGVGAGMITAGREIAFQPESGVDERIWRMFFLGCAMGTLLHQRGWPILHASSVSIEGEAVAFLAFPGGGKSTTAAAFIAAGAKLVADDIVAVRLEGNIPQVYAGFPQLKLWPEAAAAAFGDQVEDLPLLHPGLTKRVRPVPRQFHGEEAIPLRRLYVLAEGEQVRITPVAPQDRVIELVRHSFGALYLHLGDPVTNLNRCLELAIRIPVRRLERPLSLDSLGAVTSAVREDLCAD